MKRYLYVLLLIMSALIVDVCAQTSPTYDDKTPPAFEWGKGKMNAQKQGTPTTGDQEIIANINVNVENTNEALGSISSYLNHTVGTETKSVAALLNEIANQDPNVTLGDISVDTSSIDTALANINNKLDDDLATITRGINTNIESLRWTEFRHANSVKSEDDVATDTVVSLLREIKNKEAGDVELSETNNLISSNTEKLSAKTTHTVPNYYDDSLNTSSIKSIAEMIAEQLGSTVNHTSYETDSEGNPYETYPLPTVCRLVSDIAEMINNVIVDNYEWYFNYQTYDSEGNFSGSYPSLVGVGRETLEDGSDKEFYVGAAQALMSPEPVEITATHTKTLTVADGLFTDKEGNPTHVLGRILQAVENGGSGTVGSVSVDLDKIERGVGVLLHEGSEGGKGEVPEMEINLVDMFYDKGTGIGYFRGDDSAYLDEGISMYDMTKAGLFGLDEYSNVKPLLKDMLQVSFSADSSMPKMADVVYGISSKIPQNAIASISQETFSSRIHLGNIYTKLGTLDNRVATLTSLLREIENKEAREVTMDTVRYSNGSHGTGDTASVLFDGTLRAVPNFKIDAGPNTSPIKDKTERVFVEFKVPLATQTFFVGFKNDEKHLRPVTGRALFEVGTQDLYIKIPSDSGIDYLWITEGWR